MSGADPWTGSNMMGACGRVDVAAGGQADSPGDRGGEVGEDVAKQVVGHDDVEAARVGDQEDRCGIDVQGIDSDVRKLLRHRLHRASPQVPA